VHWPLTGGLYTWYSNEGTGRAVALPSPLIAVPNLAAHPSTASVPTSWEATRLCVSLKPCNVVHRSLKLVLFESLGIYGFLFTFHSNYGRIFSGFDTTHERDRHRTTASAALRSFASLQSRAKNQPFMVITVRSRTTTVCVTSAV